MTASTPIRRGLLILCITLWIGAAVATHLPKRNAPSLHTSDKILHVVGYAGLSAIFFLTMAAHGIPLKRRILFGCTILLLLYAPLDEITQPLVGRHASVWDWCADAVGVAAIVILDSLITWISRRRIPPGELS